MKIAFVIPFAFERFFNDSKELFPFAERFEDEIISKRSTWHFNWCKAMTSAGIDVTFFHISRYGRGVREYYHNSGIKIVRVPTSFLGIRHKNEFSLSLLKEIKKYNPDIIFSVTNILEETVDMYDVLTFFFKFKGYHVITRNPGADTFGLIYNQRSSLNKKLDNLRQDRSRKAIVAKLILIYKLIIISLFSKIKFIIKKKSLSISDLIIPQTQIDYDNLVNKFHIRKKKLIMLPKPIDISNFQEIGKEISAKILGQDPVYKYILHVSNLFDTKGCENIIEIMPELINKYEKIILIISGGGVKKKDLESLVKLKNLDKNVLFCGQISHEQLVNYYNLADVFVLPTNRSFGEGIPNVVLEAIACNTPPVCTNIPGPSAILSEDLGLLVEMGNSDELFSAISKVLDGEFKINETRRNQLLREYSIENTGKLLFETFQNVIIN